MLYLFGMIYIGFFVSSAIFMAVVMIFLKVPWKQILISDIAVLVLLYVAFVIFLKVKLPSGILM